MGRKATLVALMVMCATVMAQVSRQPQAAPRAALAELRSLRTMQTLQVSQQQAADILEALANVSKRQQDYSTWAAGQTDAASNTVQAAVTALSHRLLPTRATVGQAKTILNGQDQQIQSIQQAAEAAAEQVYKIGDVSTKVQSENASNASAQGAARYDGASSPAEYIVDKAQALRMLNNGTYRLVRLVESQRIAERIVGRRGRVATQLAAGIRNALDSLRALPDQDFDTGRAALIQQVATNLNVAGPPAGGPPMSWPDFVDWLTRPATAKLMADLSGQPAPTVSPVAKGVEGSLYDLRTIMLLLNLQLGREQVASLGQLLASVGVDKKAADVRLDQADQNATKVLPKILATVKGGQAAQGKVADSVQTALANSDAAQNALRTSMAAHVTSFRRILAPAQRALVDWTATGAGAKPSAQGQVVLLRREAGVIREGLDVLNKVKFARGTQHNTAMATLGRPLVARYVDPRGPDFSTAYDSAIRLISEARFVNIDQWRAGADVEYATQLMAGLGALNEASSGPAPNAIYGWGDIYEILLGTANTPLATAFGG